MALTTTVLRPRRMRAVTDLDAAKGTLLAELREHSLVLGEVTLASGAVAQYYVDARRTLMRPTGFLAAGEGAVWVQEQGDGTVAKIDPATATVVSRTKVGDNLKYGDIDTGDGKVWLRTTDEQTFVILDAKSGEVLSRLGKAAGSGALRYTPDGVWTTAHDVHTLSWWSTEPAAGN